MIKFTIPLIPKSQMRARHFVKKTKSGKFFRGTHKAPDQERYELQFMQLLEQHIPEKPLEGALVLGITAFLPIPQSKSYWWKEAAERRIIYPITTPDLDNLIKNLKDCMQKIGFFRNDSQIVGYEKPFKLYSVNPRWEISLIELLQPRTKKEYEAWIDY